MEENEGPSGWNERKVRRVLRHYESQTEDEAIGEDKAAFELKDQTVMVVPRKLVAEITKLIPELKTAPPKLPPGVRRVRTLHGHRSYIGQPSNAAPTELAAPLGN